MRYVSIDLLRTAAIFLMVTVHFLENLSGVNWAPAGLGAPMFGFLVGVSYRIWLNAQFAKNRDDDEISRSTFRRGLFIFVLGFIFNLVVWLPADTFNWDVLTLIGTALLLLGMLRDFPNIVPITLCIIIVAISPVLRIYSGYAEYWTEGYFDPDWTFSQLALGYLVNGYFPVLPWLVFPLVGFVVGGSVLPESPHSSNANPFDWRTIRATIGIGLGFVFASLTLRFTRSEQTGLAASLLGKWTMFPPSVEYLTGMMGCILIAFSLAIWWIDGRRLLDSLTRLRAFLRTMSQYSLSIYIFHHIIHIWPLWIVGAFSGHNVTYYWRQAMPWPASIALIVPCVAVSFFLFRWVEKGNRPSVESVMRRLGEGRKGKLLALDSTAMTSNAGQVTTRGSSPQAGGE